MNLNGIYRLAGGIQLNGEYRDLVPGYTESSGCYTVHEDTIVSKKLWENTDRPMEKHVKSGDKLIGNPIVDSHIQATEDMILECIFVKN